MAWYEVTKKDGTVAEVEANSPEEASKLVLRKTQAPPPPAPEARTEEQVEVPNPIERQVFDKLGSREQFEVGVGQNFNELQKGVKGLFTDLTDQEQADIDTADRGIHGIPAGVGEVLTDTAILGPAMAARGGLTKALEAAGSVGYETLKAPSEDTSRAERGISAGIGIVAGDQLMKQLSKVWKGSTPSPEGQELIDLELTKLTPGQQGGKLTRIVEAAMGKSGLTQARAFKLQQDALKEWNQKITQDISDSVGYVPNLPQGDKGVKLLGNYLDTQYEKLWRGAYDIDFLKFKQAMADVRGDSRILGGADLEKDMVKLTSEIVDDFKRTVNKDGSHNGRIIDMIDSRLKGVINKMYKGSDSSPPNPEMAERLKNLQASLIDSLPPDLKTRLGNLDTAWGRYKAVQNVSAKNRGKPYTPSDLVSETISGGNRRSITEGHNKFLDSITPIVDTFERVNIDPKQADAGRIVDMVISYAGSLGNPDKMVSETVRKAITGRTVTQAWLRKFARMLKEKGASPTVISAAMGAATEASEITE